VARARTDVDDRSPGRELGLERPLGVDVHELERFRRSLRMLTPGQFALRREEALALLAELSTCRSGSTCSERSFGVWPKM
jgi:hypothetical protein